MGGRYCTDSSYQSAVPHPGQPPQAGPPGSCGPRFSPPFPIRIDRSDDDIVTPCVPLRVVTAVTASSWHGGVVGGDGASARWAARARTGRRDDAVAFAFDLAAV